MTPICILDNLIYYFLLFVSIFYSFILLFLSPWLNISKSPCYTFHLFLDVSLYFFRNTDLIQNGTQ